MMWGNRSLLALAALLTVIPASAQPVPRSLLHYMPYGRARSILLGAGWTPVTHDKRSLLVFERDTQAWYLEHGFDEIETCAPTGDGTCVGEFKGRDGRALFVYSSNGAKAELPPDGEPNFFKACRRRSPVC